MGPNHSMWFCIKNVKGCGVLAQQLRRRSHFIWMQLHSFPKLVLKSLDLCAFLVIQQPDFLLYKEETFLHTRTITIKNYCLKDGVWVNIALIFFHAVSNQM